MKILIDARLYGLEHAGIGRYLVNLVNELQKIDQNNRYILLLRKKYFRRLVLSKNWKKILADFGHYTIKEQIRLPKILNNQKSDLVHFPHLNICVFWQGKFVVTLHDMTMHRQGTAATTLSLPIYYLKRVPYKYIFRKAVTDSRKIIVPSKAVKKDLVDYFGVDEQKIVVTYEGLDPSILKKTSLLSDQTVLTKYNLRDQKYFFYVGNAYPHKNLDRVVEAISLINKKADKKIIFAIASSRNVFTQRLERKIQQYRAKEFVKLLGFVPDGDLGVLFKNSIAFIYPSLSEGFGLPGLESIAAGTIVLASDIPVFKEVYKDNVLYFNPFDFTSIEQSMRDVLNMSTKDREKLIKKGQKFTKRYSWTKMAKQTLEVYKEAVRV